IPAWLDVVPVTIRVDVGFAQVGPFLQIDVVHPKVRPRPTASDGNISSVRGGGDHCSVPAVMLREHAVRSFEDSVESVLTTPDHESRPRQIGYSLGTYHVC